MIARYSVILFGPLGDIYPRLGGSGGTWWRNLGPEGGSRSEEEDSGTFQQRRRASAGL